MAAIKSAIVEWNIDAKPYSHSAILYNGIWRDTDSAPGTDLGAGLEGLKNVLKKWHAEALNGGLLFRQQYAMRSDEAPKIVDVVNNTVTNGTYYIREISGPAYQAKHGQTEAITAGSFDELVDVLVKEFPALELAPASGPVQKSAAVGKPRGLKP